LHKYNGERRIDLNSYLIANIFVMACAMIGFIWGAVVFFRPRKAMYAQMITLALGCISFGRLFIIIRLLTEGSLNYTFQLGYLGMIGSLMFFISSNYGAIDSLVDDGTKKFRKYRLTAMTAPVIAIIAYVLLFLIADISLVWKVMVGVLTVFIVFASYFHLKHLVFPDVDYGVVNFLHAFNLVALLYDVALIFECYAMSRENQKLTMVSTVITGLVVLLLMPMVIRGVKRWYQ